MAAFFVGRQLTFIGGIDLNKLIFITGGVRSGKSAFAEKMTIQIYKENKKSIYYLATGVAFDEEMKKRIYHHQMDREKSQIQWNTIEFECDIPLVNVRNGDVLLWDCITTWVNNVLYKAENEKAISQYIEQFKKTIIDWRKRASIILVSNEVLDENQSQYKEVELYRRVLGNLHQWIVEICDEAYEMDYGLILRKK